MKTRISCLLLLATFAFAMNAQVVNYEGMRKRYSTGVKAIIEHHEVKGYYVFYFLDKANKKENLYSFNLLDENMDKTHSVELTRPKRESLLEISFNGTHFCLSFVEPREKYLEYLVLDKTGKQVATYKVTDISKNEIAMYMTATESEDEEFMGGIAPITGKGFVRYGMEKENGWRYVMEMFDNNGKKVWEANSGATSKKSYETGSPLFSNDKYLITNISMREKIFTSELDYFVAGYDAATGKEKFKLEMTGTDYFHFPLGVNYEDASGEFFVYGEYYKPGKNPISTKSLGFFIKVVDAATGKVKQSGYCSYEKDVTRIMPVSSRGKLEDGRNFTIHRMTRTADGKIFAVAEQFKKAVSGLGVAANMLSSSSNMSAIKVNLFDIMIFEFTPNLELKQIHIFEKDKTSVELPKGLGMQPANTLSYYLKLYGWFDYCFTSETADKKQFSIVYTNYDKDKEEGNKFILGTISYNKDQKLVTDKIPKESKSTYFLAIPAKAGYVAVFEYYRKKRIGQLRLEKLNI